MTERAYLLARQWLRMPRACARRFFSNRHSVCGRDARRTAPRFYSPRRAKLFAGSTSPFP